MSLHTIENWFRDFRSDRMAWIRLTRVVLLALFIGCSGGSNNQDSTDGEICGGGHGVMQGGTCVCDPNFVKDGKLCVPETDGDRPIDGDEDRPDGDKDLIDGDTDGDEDVDRDPDLDPDPDSDPDRIDTDGDGTETDGDSDSDPDGDADPDLDTEAPPACHCPVLNGAYCLEPGIPSPNGYERVVVAVAGEPGCRLSVSIRNVSGETVYTSELSCNVRGQAVLAEIGCQFIYLQNEDTVRLFCDPALYSFAPTHCELPVDGDQEPDSPDGDSPDGDQTDGDGSDGDEADSEEETPPAPCDTDEECEQYMRCKTSEHICVPGQCNETRNCAYGYECDFHGYCLPKTPVGDEDFNTACTAENEDWVCAWGDYCLTITGTCTHDCRANSDCPDAQFCYPDRGRCLVGSGQTCSDDNDCPEGDACDTLIGYCVYDPNGGDVDGDQSADGDAEGGDGPAACDEGNPCEYGCACIDGYCRQDCLATEDCIAAHGENYICNESCLCEFVPDCELDTDCTERHFCNEGFCDQICADDNGCGIYEHCDEFGRCQQGAPEGDGDVNTVCFEDAHCPLGEMCEPSGEEKICVPGECQSSSQCEIREGYYLDCDSHGRCQYYPLESDEDIEYHQSIPCTNDEECPDYKHCQIDEVSGWCVGCVGCAAWEYCGLDGYCHLCDGDMECAGAEADVNTEADYNVDIPCQIVTDCPEFYYCSETGKCETECLPSCPEQHWCNTDTRLCEPLIAADRDCEGCCAVHADCPEGYSCDPGTYKCVAGDCVNDSDCNPGYVCDPGIWICNPARVECTHDNDCPVGTYCQPEGGDATWYCSRQCFYNTGLGCPVGQVCNERGRCADSGGGDFVFPTCSSDGGCSEGSFCSIEEGQGSGVCRSDCFVDTTDGCPGGYRCDYRTRCVEIPVDGDAEADADPDPDPEPDEDLWDGCPEPPNVPIACPGGSDALCPFHSRCDSGSQYCVVDCTGDYHCDSGQVCTHRGVCDDSAPNWSSADHPGCNTDCDCPRYTYCWQNVCRLDCLDTPDPSLNKDCPNGLTCTQRGRCVDGQ